MTSASLRAFSDDPRLPQLAALLRRPPRFNILSALGVGRQELRHSDLLAFLLDSHKPHGLGNRFARALLDRVAPLLPEALDVRTLSLAGMTVQREWNSIDILLESPADKLAVIIENKVDSDEHSDQLGRYYQLVRKHRPGWRVIGVYLTLDATPPTAESDCKTYVPLGYLEIAAMLSDLADATHVEPDVQTLLRHYAQLIRSELVPDIQGDAGRMARTLYIEHRETVEAMLRARDARQKMIQQTFDKLLSATIREQPDALRRDDYSTEFNIHRWHTRFAPAEWYQPSMQVGQRWTNSKLVLLFQFAHDLDQIYIDLVVGPSVSAPALRHALYDLTVNERPPFKRWSGDPGRDWFSIYGRSILLSTSNYFATYDDDAVRRTIREHWQDFIQRDLPAIRATIRHEILGRTWNEQ